MGRNAFRRCPLNSSVGKLENPADQLTSKRHTDRKELFEVDPHPPLQKKERKNEEKRTNERKKERKKGKKERRREGRKEGRKEENTNYIHTLRPKAFFFSFLFK